MKKVLMIAGSLRKGSFNHQLARLVEELLADRAEVQILEYADLPLLNQDMEFPVPAAVARVRQAVQEADGIWIFSPEYNYQIPGVLKNLLDWLSRPVAPGAGRSSAAAVGKAVTISGVAGKSAAAGVRRHLSALLESMSMKLIGGTGTGVALDAQAFQSGKLRLSEENLEEIRGQAEAFLSAL